MRFQPSSSSLLASTSVRLAIAMVAVSVVVQLVPAAAEFLLLIPSHALRGWVWQLLSYPFIETNVLSLLIDGVVLVMIGLGVEQSWGSRRVLVLSVGTAAVAGVLTVLLSLLVPSLRNFPFFGAGVMVTALWIAYGLSFGRMQMNFWGIPLTGNGLAYVGVGFVVLNGVFAGWRTVLPEAFGAALIFGYFRLGSPRTAWLRFSSWRLQQKLKGRARHLKLVGKDRNTSNGSDRYLH
jgi:membrane associated rhomboid family serine protease